MTEEVAVKLPLTFYWFILLVAVTGVSCAGAMFQQVDDVPPVLRASWRLQVTSLILFLPAVVQFINADDTLRSRIFMRNNLLIMAASGCFVGAHFASWVASLDLTTLTHSLLFVTAHPLVVVCGMLILHRVHDSLIVPVLQFFLPKSSKEEGEEEEDHEEHVPFRRVRDPSFMELAGAILGFIGAGITFLDVGATQGKHTVTAEGDGLAFLGAIFLVLYLLCGRVLREWMPVFIYAFPVTFIGALVLLPISAGIERNGFQIRGAVGWYKSSSYIQWFFALALIAGLCGREFFKHSPITSALLWNSHTNISNFPKFLSSANTIVAFASLNFTPIKNPLDTGMNMVLSRLSPLIVCTAATTEPVIGSLIGWALFNSGAPSLWTYLGGSVLLCGLLLVVYGSSHATGTDTGAGTDTATEMEAGVAALETREYKDKAEAEAGEGEEEKFSVLEVA